MVNLFLFELNNHLCTVCCRTSCSWTCNGLEKSASPFWKSKPSSISCPFHVSTNLAVAMEGATFRKPRSLFGKSGCNIPLGMALYPSSSFRISSRVTFSRSARSFSASSSANHSNFPLQHWSPCNLVCILTVCTCTLPIAPNFSSVGVNNVIDCVLWYVPTICASLLGANIILILLLVQRETPAIVVHHIHPGDSYVWRCQDGCRVGSLGS